MNDSQSLQQKAKQPKKKIRKFRKAKQLARPQEAPTRSIIKKQPETPPFSFAKRASRSSGDFFLALIPLVLFVVLVILLGVNRQTHQQLQEQKIRSEESLVKMYPYPLVNAIFTPELSAKAAIITDADSQVILFSKNPNVRFSMASTTKVMTALTALDYYPLDAVLTIKTPTVEGSGLGLTFGEQFTFLDLLYAMMLPSANDAAVAIADNYPGGVTAFVAKMNEKAISLHLSDTHFADPAGLEDDGDYTTVVDLARLGAYAIGNKTFVQVTSSKAKTITNISETQAYPLNNLNQLLGINGVTGIKTGTTEGAGEVLLTAATIKGHRYIVVVMHSEQRFVDTQALLTFIEKQVQYVDVVSSPPQVVQ
ncbi:MAG: serine hydrolase [Patescibacteria group bacterium]